MKPAQAHKPTSPQAHKPTSPQAHKPTSPQAHVQTTKLRANLGNLTYNTITRIILTHSVLTRSLASHINLTRGVVTRGIIARAVSICNSLTCKLLPSTSRGFFLRLPLRAGFSLVELMVVVAIIGVLASIAIPSFQSYRRKAYQAEAQSSLTHIYTAEQNFHSKWGVYIGALAPAGVELAGDLRYAVGFNSRYNKGLCGIESILSRTINFYMGVLGKGPMAGLKYTGSTACEHAAAVSGEGSGPSAMSPDYCKCTMTCTFVGSLRMNRGSSPFDRYADHHMRCQVGTVHTVGKLARTTGNFGFICAAVGCDRFAIGAATNLRGDETYEGLDLWSLTHTKNLRHLQSGL